MNIRLLISILIVLVVSLGANVFLYTNSMSLYRQLLSMKINPTGKAFDKRVSATNASAYAKTIIYFGDSRISQWDRYNSDHGVQVVNAGSPGDTSAMALMKLDANVISYKPDVVVVQIGINDMKAIGVMPDEKEFILDNYKNNLNQILDALSSENIDVILLTIFPVGDIDLLRKFVWSSDVTESINEINRYILSLSHQNLTVVDCDKLFSTNGRMNPEYQVDSFHINKLGYEMLNDFLEPYLRKL